MSRKNTILAIIAFVVIGGLYYYVYGDALKKKTIKITHTVRFGVANRRRAPAPANAAPVPTFNLGNAYKLTDVRVVALDDLKTNKYPHPLWELVSDTTSVPVELFNYGSPLRGMQPKVPGTQPESLTTNVAYRLYVVAGRIKGQHDFIIAGPEEPAAQTPQ